MSYIFNIYNIDNTIPTSNPTGRTIDSGREHIFAGSWGGGLNWISETADKLPAGRYIAIAVNAAMPEPGPQGVWAFTVKISETVIKAGV